ncbi:MAG: ACT domain-containing protein [Kiritimatiellae bacterium]|jgi:hypothetical protein|nr:ACT domain-containing protein [Kiritimatiellia bacterium]MDD4342216.1 ACT domain-containing protein [Kiritimatiellia bacterium]MDY0149659.1 ACT domain-containing protein [Kiritimatiellia bacterium]
MTTPPYIFSKAIQLTVYIDNRKGTLAKLAQFLGRHGVNIYGLTLADTEGHGYVRLIVDDTEKARQLVEDSGELIGARDVLLVQIENEPGHLGRLLAALAARNVNLDYGYSSGGPGDGKGLVLVPSDMGKALETLEELNA